MHIVYFENCQVDVLKIKGLDADDDTRYTECVFCTVYLSVVINVNFILLFSEYRSNLIMKISSSLGLRSKKTRHEISFDGEHR